MGSAADASEVKDYGALLLLLHRNESERLVVLETKQTIKCPNCGGTINFEASLIGNTIWVDFSCDTCGQWIDVATDALEEAIEYFENGESNE